MALRNIKLEYGKMSDEEYNRILSRIIKIEQQAKQ